MPCGSRPIRLDLPAELQAGLAPHTRAALGTVSSKVLEAGDRLERDVLAGCLAHPELVPTLAGLPAENFDSEANRALRQQLVEGGSPPPELVPLLAELDALAAREADRRGDDEGALVAAPRARHPRASSRGRRGDLERTKESRLRSNVSTRPSVALCAVDDPLVIAGREFASRLITGTGKYPSLEAMRDAVVASGCELVTVAVRRIDLDEQAEAITDWLPEGVMLLPNTAGCATAEEAVRVARLARAGRPSRLDQARGDHRSDLSASGRRGDAARRRSSSSRTASPFSRTFSRIQFSSASSKQLAARR